MYDAKNKIIFIKIEHYKILSYIKENDPDPIKKVGTKNSQMLPYI